MTRVLTNLLESRDIQLARAFFNDNSGEQSIDNCYLGSESISSIALCDVLQEVLHFSQKESRPSDCVYRLIENQPTLSHKESKCIELDQGCIIDTTTATRDMKTKCMIVKELCVGLIHACDAQVERASKNQLYAISYMCHLIWHVRVFSFYSALTHFYASLPNSLYIYLCSL